MTANKVLIAVIAFGLTGEGIRYSDVLRLAP